jgi:hypothetical protein
MALSKAAARNGGPRQLQVKRRRITLFLDGKLLRSAKFHSPFSPREKVRRSAPDQHIAAEGSRP